MSDDLQPRSERLEAPNQNNADPAGRRVAALDRRADRRPPLLGHLLDRRILLDHVLDRVRRQPLVRLARDELRQGRGGGSARFGLSGRAPRWTF